MTALFTDPPAVGRKRRKPTLPPNWVRVGGDHSLHVSVPTVIESNPNKRGNWRIGWRRGKVQKQRVIDNFYGVKLPAPPVDVNIVRQFSGRQRPFDDDNCTAGAKSIRDAVALLYGLDDKDRDQIRFTVEQKKGEPGWTDIDIIPRNRKSGVKGIVIGVKSPKSPRLVFASRDPARTEATA